MSISIEPVDIDTLIEGVLPAGYQVLTARPSSEKSREKVCHFFRNDDAVEFEVRPGLERILRFSYVEELQTKVQ